MWAGLHIIDFCAIFARARRNRPLLSAGLAGVFIVITSIIARLREPANIVMSSIQWLEVLLLQSIFLVLIAQMCKMGLLLVRFAAEVNLRPGHEILGIVKLILGLIGTSILGCIGALFVFNLRAVLSLIFGQGVLVSILLLEFAIYLTRKLAMAHAGVFYKGCPSCKRDVFLMSVAVGLCECSGCGQSFLIKKINSAGRIARQGVVLFMFQNLWRGVNNWFWWLALKIIPARKSHIA